MLQKLSIKNIALIDSVDIDFTEGLNVLSGETGSGKSVVIESLNFVLGAKADKSFIRSGQNECLVSVEFSIDKNSPTYFMLGELGLESDETVIIARRFTVDGKSTIKVNGETVTVGMLRKITQTLVDVHGQSEHFALLSSANQLKLIDSFGDKEIFGVKSQLKTTYGEYLDIKNQLDMLGGDETQRLTRLDILNFQINEINEVDLKDGEEEELLSVRQKLIHQEKIVNALSLLKESISGEGGVDDILLNACRNLSCIADFGEDFKGLYSRLDNVYTEISDIENLSNNILDSFDDNEYDVDYVENRLEKIKTVKKKYGNSYEEIQTFLQNALLEKDKLENFNENAEKLLTDKAKLEDKLYSQYTDLSNLRRKYANTFSQNIVCELRELGMASAKFDVLFNDMATKHDCAYSSGNGFDEVEFRFSANAGEPLKPLSLIISGGEISRFMLAIKAQTAKYNDIATFIFDEIDVGISGTVAFIVSQKFAKISKDVQIIAITHLPQISAMADNNLLISKYEKNNKTTTVVERLNDLSKINEIARLSGGEVGTDTAVAYAQSIIKRANEYKNSL